MVEIGQTAPEFEAPTANGTTLKLSSLRGSPVVLYFYPMADTPGCTIESKGFRDHYAEFQQKHVQIVGISTDPVQAQEAFAGKYGLPFPLVADFEKKVAGSYGVLGSSGRARRVSFFLDPKGTVVEIVDASKAEPHIERAKARFLTG